MPLSPRETEILRLIAAGRTTKAVAAALGVMVSTVEWHVSNILLKLQASSRTEAVAIAMREGLLGPVQEVTAQEERGARLRREKDVLDVLDRVLDKGIVIHAQVNVSVGGIQLIGIEGRAVAVSIDTYLKERDRQGPWPVAAGPERIGHPSEAVSEEVTRAVEEYLRRLRPDAASGDDR